MLNAESANFVELFKKSIKPYNEYATIEEARAVSNKAKSSMGGDYKFKGERTETFVPWRLLPTAGVERGTPVYIYKPREHSANPVILIYFHGGGFTVGSRTSVDVLCQILCDGAQCIVVNVEYRLAPEHKFPAAFDDSQNVLEWVMTNRVEIGGSAESKIGVGGDSAGGTIAAAAAHDFSTIISFQLLIYPRVLPEGDYSLPSYAEFKDGPVLTRDLMLWFEKQYTDPIYPKNQRYSVILRKKFDYLPPALFIVAECDPIRDDSYAYAKKLTDAGVANELFLVKGACHGFYSFPGYFKETTKPAYEKSIAFIKQFAS